jgi:hypothetical protein
MGGAVPGVVGIVSVRVDGLREAISGTVIIGSMDGCPVVIDASSSSKSSLVAINGGCRERHQTKKARQHEYVINNPGLTQLARRMYMLINWQTPSESAVCSGHWNFGFQ